MPRSPGHQNTARGLLVEVTRKEDYYRGFQRKGSSQHALLEGLALAVLLALALPRHPPHEPPRAAPRLLLRRRLARRRLRRFARRRLRDRWAAAARQLDGLLLKFLPRFFYFVRRAGPVLKKFLGDLFGLFLVADDLRGGRSFSFEILSRRRRRRRGVITLTASARWRGGLPAGGRRVGRGPLRDAKAVVSVRRDPPRRRRQGRRGGTKGASLGCPTPAGDLKALQKLPTGSL